MKGSSYGPSFLSGAQIMNSFLAVFGTLSAKANTISPNVGLTMAMASDNGDQQCL